MIEFKQLREELFRVCVDKEIIGDLYTPINTNKMWCFYIVSHDKIEGTIIYGNDIPLSESLSKAKNILKEILQ